MGLLDDSIREHLELKRRRGADTAEVARQEQEAFGPPRRGEFDAAPAAAQAVAEHEHHEHAHDFEAAHAEPEPSAAEAPTALHAVEDLPHVQDEPPRPHGDPADALPQAAPVTEEHHAVAEDRLVPDPGQPTRAFDADEVRAAAGVEPVHEPELVHEPVHEPEPAPEPTPTPAPRAAEDEEEEEAPKDADVLEETPEFLQETPEHDRLWFEQRPPRDFDF